ncbi:hypothetical protein AXK57_07630 [Tsukamurella pulmonis]|uniref:aminotransferase-like domain-containing protein n=1 Tax=Tsukamurella pulmonis TaxID=47312 RepID=UPI00079A6865|nr:PLP-dependent aminotransferase family protein [Tsukamurella pulmonis]KXP11219.1 hypothetical protein AXK57_07630 [Tsukamurella pulmonis]RDH11275.1 PLP-dependent aminotransferase family protein [Tsukamurella pulmonis]
MITRTGAGPDLFTVPPGTVSLAGGMPALGTLPWPEIAAATGATLELAGPTVLQYGRPVVGSTLARRIRDLLALQGADVDAAELIPTAGSQMGLCVVAAVLGRDADTVLCEAPSYPGALAAFRDRGLEPVAVPADADGVDPDAVAGLVRRRRTAFLYVNPTFHNPTGRVMPQQRRRDLLAACAAVDLPVVEDDPYGLLSFDGHLHTSLLALAGPGGDVIHLGTASKIFAPGLRVGWIAAPAHRRSALAAQADLMSLSPSVFAQGVVADFLAGPSWPAQLDVFRREYRERAEIADGALRSAGAERLWRWERPRGGFYLWLTARAGGVDAEAVAERARRAGVLVVPGRHFSVAGESDDGLRLCFTGPRRAQLAPAVERLGAVLAEAGA